MKHIDRNETKTGEQVSTNSSEIIKKISEANKKQVTPTFLQETLKPFQFQTIHNSFYGPITNHTVILVVQVHNRVAYLRHLISSLSLVTSIHTTLIIFSHDVWDEQINTLVRSIDFTATLQIFYPYSIQTHPNIFPGPSHSDCPRDGKTTKK